MWGWGHISRGNIHPSLCPEKTALSCGDIQLSSPSSPSFLLFREVDDVFAPEILDPYCKFCYAKKFKTSAIKIAEIVEIAPELGFVI